MAARDFLGRRSEGRSGEGLGGSHAAVMQDGSFDALVDTLHALTLAMADRGEIDRGRIRVAPCEHGAPPHSVASEPCAEEGLSALLHAIGRPSAGAERSLA
jgi:hypothetical protein